MLPSIQKVKIPVLLAGFAFVWSCANNGSSASDPVNAEFVRVSDVPSECATPPCVEPFGFSITNSSPDCSLAVGSSTTPVYPDISIPCNGTLFDVSDNSILPSFPMTIVLYCPNSFAFSTALGFVVDQTCTLNHVYRFRLDCLRAGQTSFSKVSEDLSCL